MPKISGCANLNVCQRPLMVELKDGSYINANKIETVNCPSEDNNMYSVEYKDINGANQCSDISKDVAKQLCAPALCKDSTFDIYV